MNVKKKPGTDGGIFDKTLLKIFMVLLFILSIMFLSNYFVYRNSMNEMFKQAERNNELVVNGIIQSFEKSFKEINDTIYTVGTLPFNLHDPRGHDNVNMNSAYRLIRSMGQMVSGEYIEDFIVFFKDSQLALTLSGTENFNRVFSKKYKSERYAPEYWKNFAMTNHSMKVIPADYYYEHGASKNGKQLLAIVASNQVSSTVKNVIVFVDVAKLYQTVNKESMMTGSSLIILDKDKNIILQTDGSMEERLEEAIVDSAIVNQGEKSTIHSGKYSYHTIKSEYNSFTYINKVPYRYEGAMSAIRYNRIMLIATTIAGVGISLLLSLYLYSPLRKILWLVGRKVEDRNYNSYQYVYNHIEKMQMEQEQMNSKMDYVKDEVMHSIFFRMIDDVTFYKQMKDQIDTYFKAIFFHKHFLMVGLEFTAMEQENTEHNFHLPVETDEIRKRIKESLENKGQGNLSVVVFYLERMRLVALIGMEDPVKRMTLMQNIEELKEELKEALSGEYGVSAVVGKIYEEASHCKEAFDEIKMCFDYRSINNTKALLDLEKQEYNYDIYMPLDFEERLSNYILSGNEKEGMELITEVMETNISNNVSFHKFQYVINNTFHTIVKLMVRLSMGEKEIEKAEKEFRQKMKGFSVRKNYKEFFSTLVKQTADKARDEVSGKLNKEIVLQYMHLHFQENLYLDRMAEVFNTSPKYFSNFFKKAFGVNFVEYLNKLRISHAKDLLKNTEIPVNEIGEKIGYLNPSTFSSTFKKYCGVTPSEYRKNKAIQK